MACKHPHQKLFFLKKKIPACTRSMEDGSLINDLAAKDLYLIQTLFSR